MKSKPQCLCIKQPCRKNHRQQVDRAYYPKEDEESMAFSQWLRLKGLMYTYIGNDSGLPPRVAMLAAIRKKKLGLSAGFPDFVIVTDGGILYCEMKRAKKSLSTVSPEQKTWIAVLNNCPGAEARVCYGAEEAIKFVQEFL